MGPLPKVAERAGIRGIRRKRDPSEVVPADFFGDSSQLRALFARLVGASDPARVAILPSVSYGVAIAARNAGLRGDQEVVLARDQFPGNVYGWMRAAAEAGARIRIVDPPPGGRRGREWNQRLLDAIGPRTRVVALAPLHWTDGTLFDLDAIRARAREVGALLVVDGTQSVGAMPLSVSSLEPDALIVAAYKWLLGPYSLALGYFGPAFDDGVPLEETWIGREGSEEFGGLVNYRDEYGHGAVRYDVGERSNFILLPMAIASLGLLDRWTPSTVADHCRDISRDFLDWTRERGLSVEEEGFRAPHLFGLRLPDSVDQSRLATALERRRVSVSVRGASLRVSPHLYNDASDLSALREALEEGL